MVDIIFTCSFIIITFINSHQTKTNYSYKMGNKSGSNRFSAIEQDVLLEAVQDKLPTGADEWELVQVFFKKRMVEVASQNGTGNNQVAVQVYDRDSKSLKALFGRFKNAKSPTGM